MYCHYHCHHIEPPTSGLLQPPQVDYGASRPMITPRADDDLSTLSNLDADSIRLALVDRYQKDYIHVSIGEIQDIILCLSHEGGIHSTVVACWTAGQKVEPSVLHQGHDSL